MCKERLFNTVGWGKVYNNLGYSLSLFQDNLNRDRCFVNSGEVLVINNVKNGWVYSVTKTILADITEPIMETIQKLGCHTFLYHLINTGHFFKLTSLLSDITVFVPTDEAFERMPGKMKKRLKDDRKYLLTLIMYHLSNTRYLSTSFHETREITTSTWDGVDQIQRRVFVTGKGNGTAQHASVIKPDVLALNGVVHVINEVLIPPTQTLYDHISGKKRFRLLLKILHAINSPILRELKDKTAHITLLAPTNRALKNFLRLYNTTENDFKTNKKAKRKLRHVLLRHFLIEPYFVTSSTPSLDTDLQTYTKDMIYKNKLKTKTKFEKEIDKDKYQVVPLVQRGPRVVEGQKINPQNLQHFKNDIQLNSTDDENLRPCLNSNQVLYNTKLCLNYTQTNSGILLKPIGVSSGNITNLNNHKLQKIQLQKDLNSITNIRRNILPKSFIKVRDFYYSLTRRNIPVLNGVVHVVRKVLSLDEDSYGHLKKPKWKRKKKRKN